MTALKYSTSSDPQSVPRTRVERGMFFADIIVDHLSDPVQYIVVLQQRGSSQVIRISNHLSMDEAQKSARHDLERLAARAA
jgi:hypothetical protein